MNVSCISPLLLLFFYLLAFPFIAQSQEAKPVTPKASAEATALLEYIYSISGKFTLSGQHNFPISGDRNTQFAGDYIGKTPVVWSQDFGFAADGDKDSYLARPSIIKEAIRQHKIGSIITLCWHAVPPTADEPITFQPLPGSDSTKLASVQGRLQDQQFVDLLTPGTEIHKRWLRQVDEIASYLKQLQEANVPVLWRPYHEMNGNWFWWGGRTKGSHTTAALYKQIFDRFVKHHKLKNLIWVWSIDRPSKPEREFFKYYPGTEYLDILSLDVYGSDFHQSYYDSLMALSQGKPLVLGEVGNPPLPEILEKQPNWAFWVTWSGMTRNTSKNDYKKLTNDPHTVFMEDSTYINSIAAYRKRCGLDPLVINRVADFTGEWRLSECESSIEKSGSVSSPYKLNILHENNELTFTSTSIVEWGDDEVTQQRLTLDGKDIQSTTAKGSPRVQNAKWSLHQDTLTINSKVSFRFGDRPVEIKSNEVWYLEHRGTKLVIIQTADGFMGRGQRKSTLVYNKQ
ncbi:MAG TPA: glycosyl hydrolase [Ohtaekwangia sp.]|nr:glycosyl hydrolase [Ohtaekwangia sp.]